LEDLLGLILALFEALKKRGERRGGAPAPSAAPRSVATLQPRSARPRSATGLSPPSAVPASSAAAFPPVTSLPSSGRAALGGSSAGDPTRPAAAVASSPEAGLVTGLFATPRSLVAAFIVSEVLAKPVALRDQ
jgi:hypothetical protein